MGKIAESSIFRNAFIVFAMTMFYRLFGFVRELLIAYTLGVSPEADAYYLAFATPNLVVNVIAFGAVSSAAVPLFIKYIEHDDIASVISLFNKSASIILVALVVLTAFLLFNADIVVGILAPGFSTQYSDLTIDLLRKMLPAVIFIGLLGIATSVLHAFGDFFTVALSNVVFNILMVSSGIVFIYIKQIDILAYAVVVAAIAQCSVLFLKLRAKSIAFKFTIDLHDKSLALLLRLMLPIFIGTIITQLNLAVGRGFASTLEQGSLSALHYADKLINLPMGVLISAVTVVTYPVLASYIVSGEREKLIQTVQQSFKALIFIIVPIVIVFNFLSVPIINILFERGNFSRADTILTASALAFYSYGIIGAAFVDLCNKIFFSYQDTIVPLKISMVSVILNIFLIVILLPYWEYKAIALSFSVSSIVNAAILLVILYKRYFSHGLVISKTIAIRTVSLMWLFVLCNYSGILIFDRFFLQESFGLRCLGFFSIIVTLFLLYVLLLDRLKIFAIKNILRTGLSFRK